MADVIKWDPSGSDANDIICYKHETEDFKTGAQVIVHQSQEAVFLKDGQVLDTYGPGLKTLTTDNIRFWGKLINKIMDGKTPFHCEVFFVNKVFQADIKWGTPSMQTLDPVENIIINVGASGTCGARIENSSKFLTKLVGTRAVYTREDLRSFLRSSIIMEVKDALSQIMNKRKISFFQATTEVKSFSVEVMAMLNEKYKEYGLEIFKFDWETLHVPDEDLKMLKDAKNKAAAGYTAKDEMMFDVLKTAAGNQGMAGSMMGFGMGAGMGMPFGMGMANMAQNMMGQTFAQPQQMQQPIQPQQQIQPQAQQPQPSAGACVKCGAGLVAGARFCPSCGAQVVAPAKRFCINCGTEINGEMKFCPTCGHKTEG